MSENIENINEVTEAAVDETVTEAAEVELELDDIGATEEEVSEAEMTTGEKVKTLLMQPLVTSIIKWVFIGLGLVGLVLYLLASESLAGIFGGVKNGIATVFGLIPISMVEIAICAAAVGILAYLVFIIVRTFQVKGKFRKGGLWVQFGYSVLAVAGAFALLFSMCYGVFTVRDPLSKQTDYRNAKVTNYDFSRTMLYLIDGCNNAVVEGKDDFVFVKSGSSKYSANGRSTEAISKAVSVAFDNASQDIPTLKGSALKAKELLFSNLYSKFRIGSVYSPVTAEICINSEYPEVVTAFQIAKSMAMQRGYTDDGTASFIAFLVCTQYSEDSYLNYAGYFNAYVEFSSKFYTENGKNLHLYMANALKENVKKEYVTLVKKLDKLYGLSSDIEYTAAQEKLPSSDYCDVAKLMMVDFENSVDAGEIQVDATEKTSYGIFCNYLTNYFLLDSDFDDACQEVYLEYHPSKAN